MSKAWQHDSSGISSLDEVHSGIGRLSRTSLDKHLWDAVAEKISSRSGTTSTLSETLQNGLLRQPQILSLILEHLPVHLVDALFVNIQQHWPPSALTLASCPAPFRLWLHSYSKKAYDGLVLRDSTELSQLAHFDVLTCLDLVDARIDDPAFLEIKNATGRTLRALRVSSTKITDMGIRKMTASLPDNFQNLVMLSFYGSTGITDRAMLEFLKFPRLACIDLRGTSATSASVQIAKGPSVRIAFKSAPRQDRSFIRPNKPLAESCEDLERILKLPGPRKAVVNQIERDLQLTSAKERQAKQTDMFTPTFGHFYSTSALSRESLLEAAGELTAKGRAFRSNHGGEVAGGRLAPDPRQHFGSNVQPGLLERIHTWSNGQWDVTVTEEKKKKKKTSRLFRGNAEPDLEDQERLLEGPFLLRRLPPELMVQQETTKAFQSSSKAPLPLRCRRRLDTVPTPLPLRHSSALPASASAVSSVALLGIKRRAQSKHQMQEAKRARLDKLLPPQSTRDDCAPSFTTAASRMTSSTPQPRVSLGTMGSLSQKRSSLGAFKKSSQTSG